MWAILQFAFTNIAFLHERTGKKQQLRHIMGRLLILVEKLAKSYRSEGSPIIKREKLKLALSDGLETNGIVSALAPLAGYSDLPFRQLCHRNGARLVTTELVSAAGIRYSGLEKSWRYLAIDPAKEGPVLIQLFGSNPDDFLYATEAILNHPILKNCWGIDINMGCPVPKVVKTGAGSALMDQEDLASRITESLAEVLHAENYVLGAKIRRGFKGEIENSSSLAVKLVEAGCDVLTVHGRFREQYYSGQADWGSIARVESKLVEEGLREGLLLFANGDINSLETARSALGETKADAVAIGRAAQGNPWIFSEFQTTLVDDVSPEQKALALTEEKVQASPKKKAEITTEEKAEDILEHAKLLIDFVGEQTAMREFRKTLSAYTQGHPLARQLRGMSSSIETLMDVEVWLQQFVDLDRA